MPPDGQGFIQRRPQQPLQRQSRTLPSRCLRQAGSGHSPSARWSNRQSLPACATTSAIGVLPSMTNNWLSKAFSLANFFTAPSTIFSTMSAGLPLSEAFSRAMPRSRSSVSASSPLSSSDSGNAAAMCIAKLLAKAIERCSVGFAFERHENADAAHAGRRSVVDIGNNAALI